MQNIWAVYGQSSHEVHTEVILRFSLPATIIWKNGRRERTSVKPSSGADTADHWGRFWSAEMTKTFTHYSKMKFKRINCDPPPRKSFIASCAVCKCLSALCLDFHHIFTESIQICCRYFAHVLVLHLWEHVIWSLAKVLSKYKAFSVVWRLFMWLWYTK